MQNPRLKYPRAYLLNAQQEQGRKLISQRCKAAAAAGEVRSLANRARDARTLALHVLLGGDRTDLRQVRTNCR